MKKTLYKVKKEEVNLQYYVSGGTNENCSNPGCSGSGGTTTPGGGCKAMGGNTVCQP